MPFARGRKHKAERGGFTGHADVNVAVKMGFVFKDRFIFRKDGIFKRASRMPSSLAHAGCVLIT
jgi:hypothetical protein